MEVLESSDDIYFLGEAYLSDGGTVIALFQTGNGHKLSVTIPKESDNELFQPALHVTLLGCGGRNLMPQSTHLRALAAELGTAKLPTHVVEGVTISRDPSLERLEAILAELERR
jgi:hypothetical protein